jgi:hypothetical protein
MLFLLPAMIFIRSMLWWWPEALRWVGRRRCVVECATWCLIWLLSACFDLRWMMVGGAAVGVSIHLDSQWLWRR